MWQYKIRSVEYVKSVLTDAKAFPSASPVCELPAAFPLVPRMLSDPLMGGVCEAAT